MIIIIIIITIIIITIIIITIIIYLFKVGMIKIAKKLIKANHLTEVKLNNPIYMFFIKILNYLHRSCIIYSCNR